MAFAPFKEGPTTVRRITTANSNSIDTRAIDPFRQGVELTRHIYHGMGLAKIHAGETDHQLRQNNVGEQPLAIYPNSTLFTETDVFDPVVFVRRDVNFDTLSPVLAFKAYSTAQEAVTDGVIEPLTIRDEIQFSSIDVPTIAHSTKGSLESGNYNSRVAADRIVTVQRFADKRSQFLPYEDNVDTFNGFPVSLGFFPNDPRVVVPFNDSHSDRGRHITSSFTGDIRGALLKMNPDTDNYVPFGYFAETAGYDDD